MKVVINLPTYNEKENLKELLPQLFQLGEEIKEELFIVVTDDSSPDGTSDYVREVMKTNSSLHLVQRPAKSGLGSAYIDGFRYGVRNLKADFVISMDADQSHPPPLVKGFLDYAPEYDIVIGSRYIPGGDFKNWPWIRKIISRGANMYGQVWLGLKVRDISSGYRCYSAKLWEKIGFDNVKTNGYCTLEEILYLAKKQDAKIKEVPLVFVDRRIGETKLKFKDMVEFFTTIFKLRFS
tara:strand:+ start:835 stop:1545 length:711 start_codon:yes stop_codon:yes gene_type:complete